MSDPASPAIARAHQLTHTWGDRPLFGPLDLLIPAGVTLVQGDEQTGKTTLLRILAGEVAPTGGWVGVNGHRSDEKTSAFAPGSLPHRPHDHLTGPDQPVGMVRTPCPGATPCSTKSCWPICSKALT